jgi:hypothetical protein
MEAISNTVLGGITVPKAIPQQAAPNDHVPAVSLSTRLFAELDALPEDKITTQLNARNELVLSVGERTYDNVRLVRCFPRSAKESFIAVVDAEGGEIGIIEDLARCRPETRQLLKQLLDMAYHIPQITKINKITMQGFVPVWDVETDRGHHVFELRSRRELLKLDDRILLRDADGNNYEIVNYKALDKHSRALLEQEI